MKPPILIIDDSLTVRMDLSDAFENAGFEPTQCASLQDARNALSGAVFELIVLDVLLPDGDGIEFLGELKTAANTAAIPVMLLSTEAQIRDRIRGLKTGAEEYVGKPYDAGYVVARAKELIRSGSGGRRIDNRTTVLVIDDSATFRNAIHAALESAAYDVVTAASGEEGLHAAVNNRPAAIIVDGKLPGIDGATVVRRLREDAALRRTPCLFLTGAEDRNEELQALEAGADGFVRKDEDFGVILARLAAVLRSASTPWAFDSQPSVLGPKKILAVDDSATFLEALGTELRQEGYDIALANSGEEALELLSVQNVDCILLDVAMPGLSGNETCRHIKTSPALREIPLLMLTAREERDDLIESVNAGADDYIFKSSDFDVVRARIRAALRRKQFEDENRGIGEQLLRMQMEAAEARAQRELAETRAKLLSELRQSEERAQIAAEAAEIGVWYWDVETGEQVWNARCKALFGLPPEARPTHQDFLHCLHPDDRARTDRVLREALANHREYDIEYRTVWPDHSIHWIVAKGRGLNDESGKPVRLSGVMMDVTDRKRTQEILVRSEKLASVGRMAATVAHEINNPLEAVVNALFLISLDHTLSEETRANLEIAERELDQVTHMTKQTLGFYRDSSSPGTVSLLQVVNEVVDLYARKLSRKRLHVEKRFRGAGELSGIAGELRQIVSNLIANAMDALPSQGRILLRISDVHVKNYGLRLTVADTGCGITREHLRSIFEPFFTTKKEVGTGLGLWVTRQIVEKHGGVIRVRSREGEGTVFTIFVPLQSTFKAQPATLEQPETNSKQVTNGRANSSGR